MQAAQIGQRVRVVVGADVEVGVRVSGTDLEPGGLLPPSVAARGLAGFHRREQALGHAAGGAEIALQRRLDDRLGGQHVAGDGNVLALHMPGPRDAVAAAVLRDGAAGVEDVELALVAQRVRAHQAVQHILSRLAGTQAGHGVDGVHRVDQRLGGQGGDTALDMDAQAANGKET